MLLVVEWIFYIHCIISGTMIITVIESPVAIFFCFCCYWFPRTLCVSVCAVTIIPFTIFIYLILFYSRKIERMQRICAQCSIHCMKTLKQISKMPLKNEIDKKIHTLTDSQTKQWMAKTLKTDVLKEIKWSTQMPNNIRFNKRTKLELKLDPFEDGRIEKALHRFFAYIEIEIGIHDRAKGWGEGRTIGEHSVEK